MIPEPPGKRPAAGFERVNGKKKQTGTASGLLLFLCGRPGEAGRREEVSR